MKLQRLELAAYGSLRGVTLELASRAPCLHVIYGPNEAGKTTALRAVTSLFYGVPEKTPDTHSIKGPELRVAGLVQDARGRELHVVRRKGRKDTLRNASGEPLPGAEASWLTAGMAEDTFRSLFGLSYATLHEGAEALLSSAGDLGHSLFSAAVGGGRVRALIEALEAEAAALFKPRGQKQLLNDALSQFADAKQKLRVEAMQASAFGEQQAGIEASEAQLTRFAAEHFALRTERERLERARRVLPLLAKRDALALERAALGELPRLAPNAADERRRVEGALRDAALRVEYELAETTRLERELAELQLPAALVALDATLAEQLRDRLGAYRRGRAELPRRREASRRAHDELSRVRARLGLTDAAIAIETLRVPRPLEARLRERAARVQTLLRSLAELAAGCTTKQAALEQQRRALLRLWYDSSAADDRSPLTAAVLPSDETLDEFERALVELEHAQRGLLDKQAQLERESEHNLRDLTALELEGAPPSEAELSQLRAARTEQFAQLRSQLEEPAAATEQAALALLEGALATTQRADSVADRLRREAKRVSEHARLTAERQRLQRQATKLTREVCQCEEQQASRKAAWRAIFDALGVRVRSARETRKLLAEQRAAEVRCSELERELRAQQAEHAQLGARLAQAQHEWQQLTESVGLSELAGSAEVEAVLEGRAELLSRHDAASAQRAELAELEQELQAFEQGARSLCEQHMQPPCPPLADAAMEQLLREYQLAREQAARRQQLTAAQSARRVELERAETTRALAQRELELLLTAARAPDLVALEQVEERCARARDLDAQLSQLHGELLTASDGQDPESVLHTVDASLDEVRARVDSVSEQLDELDRRRQHEAQQLANYRAGLARLRESHGAGDAALEAASQLEGIRALALRYARLRLSASVLEREVLRYREQNRAPILRSAGELFARLTLGGFSGLDVDYGAADELLLSCVRANAERVAVEGLSSGTRDQLYLALRLASIEHLATKQELMPLLLDDILVHFDDERARAALVALGEFAGTTQILFFTHHKRLCDLARAALPKERLRLHRLSDPQLQLTVFS